LVLQNRPALKEDLLPHEQYVLDVLLNCATGSSLSKDTSNPAGAPPGVQPCPMSVKGEPIVVPVLLSTLESISHIRIFLPKDLRGLAARETVWKSVLEVHRRFPDGIALLDPVQNMDIKDEKFQLLIKVRFPFCLLCCASEVWLTPFAHRKLRRSSRSSSPLRCTKMRGYRLYILLTQQSRRVLRGSVH
jgi:hypothetical protein